MINGIILQTTPINTVADTVGAQTEQTISLWDLAVKGGPILIPIALLSVAALYIFFERYFTIGKRIITVQK